MKPARGRFDTSGFPPEYRRIARDGQSWMLGILVLLGAATCALTAGAFYCDWELHWAVIAAAVSLLWGWATVSELRENPEELARIVPYFEEYVPGPDTFFSSGYALARSCTHLDAFAVQAGVTPLSAFGFADDYHGQRAAWHDPDEALTTVRRLLEIVRQHPGTVCSTEDLTAELERLQCKLHGARALGVRFCLHLRIDTAYTGLEFDNRKGKY